MAYNEETAERLREELEAVADITEKKMFGGVSFRLGGNMAVGVVGDELCVRVDAVEFDLKSGRVLRIGTDEPEALLPVITKTVPQG